MLTFVDHWLYIGGTVPPYTLSLLKISNFYIISKLLIHFFFHIDYPDYSHYDSQPYDQSQVKYEDEDEQKYQIPNDTNNGRNNYDDYEEGEAY